MALEGEDKPPSSLLLQYKKINLTNNMTKNIERELSEKQYHKKNFYGMMIFFFTFGGGLALYLIFH